MNKRQTYTLLISDQARRKLDLKSRGRTPLSHLFHSQYADARSPQLQATRLWTPHKRQVATQVRLLNHQVAAVLQLAEAHNIQPRHFAAEPGKYVYVTPGRILHNLLGQFLEAVITGTLKTQKETFVAPPGFTPITRSLIYERDKGICFYCKQPAKWPEGQAAHIVPQSRGGPAIKSNGVWSHRACNAAARNHIDSLFMDQAFKHVREHGDLPDAWLSGIRIPMTHEKDRF